MTTGTYEETLPCGGELRVSKNEWEVRYYFPGPNLRHKGEFVTVPGKLIDGYIEAFEANYREFETLKAVIPANSDFSKDGMRGMSIRLGRFAQGVCIRSYHMPLSTRAQLERVTDGYRYAAKRAPQIQEFLRSL